MGGPPPPAAPPYDTGVWLTDVDPSEREAIWWSGLDTMARIHRLDWRQLGLDFLDKPGRGRPGFDQQLRYYEEYFDWARQGQANPVAEAALVWVTAHAPGPGAPVRAGVGGRRIRSQ